MPGKNKKYEGELADVYKGELHRFEKSKAQVVAVLKHALRESLARTANNHDEHLAIEHTIQRLKPDDIKKVFSLGVLECKDLVSGATVYVRFPDLREAVKGYASAFYDHVMPTLTRENYSKPELFETEIEAIMPKLQTAEYEEIASRLKEVVDHTDVPSKIMPDRATPQEEKSPNSPLEEARLGVLKSISKTVLAELSSIKGDSVSIQSLGRKLTGLDIKALKEVLEKGLLTYRNKSQFKTLIFPRRSIAAEEDIFAKYNRSGTDIERMYTDQELLLALKSLGKNEEFLSRPFIASNKVHESRMKLLEAKRNLHGAVLASLLVMNFLGGLYIGVNSRTEKPQDSLVLEINKDKYDESAWEPEPVDEASLRKSFE